MLLDDGRFFVAGGNVTGRASGGGLVQMYSYSPRYRDGDEWLLPDQDVFPFGWSEEGEMAIDRWYPTLTVLPNGYVLISSGASLVGNQQDETRFEGQNTFELFKPGDTPGAGTIVELDIQLEPGATAPFSDDENPISLYPFIFVLPNGDIFYAGGENAGIETNDGRILAPDYQNDENWHWDKRVFQSQTRSGSAVMYEPGKVMKAGGRSLATGEGDIAISAAEIIDLSEYDSDEYGTSPMDGAPNFAPAASMNKPRQWHTLTLLPDGRVLATGGTRRNHERVGDNLANECENFPFDRVCNGTDVNAIGVPDDQSTQAMANGCPAVPSRCTQYNHDDDAMTPNEYACRFLGPGELCETANAADHTKCGIECNNSNECPPGSDCESGRCVIDCPEDANIKCGAVVHCTDDLALCDPGSTECNATRSAEIWDPLCDTWTELDEQEKSRMYHSSALLLPDRSVISMGGGHERTGSIMIDQYNAEIFTPEYGPAGTDNIPLIEGMLPMASILDRPAFNYGDAEAMFVFGNGSPTTVAKDFTLVRLASVTHGFDMEQRFMSLDITGGNRDDAGPLSVKMPTNPNEAPPGHYMLFLRTENGELSDGHYIRLTADEPVAFLCAATMDLTAVETSCSMEPISGTCPGGGEQQNAVDIPFADGPAGPVEGWHVFVPAGAVGDPEAPTNDEFVMLDALCAAACAAYWSSDDGRAANCSDPDAFDPPEQIYSDAVSARDLILEAQKSGEGIFVAQSLTCDLNSTCCTEFDEDLCAVGPSRVTPANDPIGTGEEYKVALGSTSTVEVVTSQGVYSSTLTGSVGYSFCREGNANAPCPFYIGSFEALASSAINASMTCADSSTARVRITNLSMKLSQPAFGIAEEATDQKGFPKGALLFESSFDIGTEHFTSRRPNTSNVIVEANGVTFDATDLTLGLTVPCNTSFSTIEIKISAQNPATGGGLGRPPTVSNTTSATGLCNASRALTATVSDPDSDASPVRWRVDGVLMAPSTTSMVVTGTHTIEAVARDARGATTTATKEVSCN